MNLCLFQCACVCLCLCLYIFPFAIINFKGAEGDLRLANEQHRTELESRDASIASRDASIASHEATIASHDASIAELQQTIDELRCSSVAAARGKKKFGLPVRSVFNHHGFSPTHVIAFPIS